MGNPKEVVEHIRSLTNRRGADLCIDAVGFEPERSLKDKIKATVNFEKVSIKVLEACMSAVRRGGIFSVLGVYAVNYDNPAGTVLCQRYNLKRQTGTCA
ncbi:hypothetical protein [Flavobacterium hungaricum]|uniref:hypothetical protein n=1 Tax=Flavobacterium hungaricum TaxID=2082725 RepID=UPI001D145072|nr:hypothetical protein [Flavobacterium hungaricum]